MVTARTVELCSTDSRWRLSPHKAIAALAFKVAGLGRRRLWLTQRFDPACAIFNGLVPIAVSALHLKHGYIP
jgi:hypothetical protein